MLRPPEFAHLLSGCRFYLVASPAGIAWFVTRTRWASSDHNVAAAVAATALCHAINSIKIAANERLWALRLQTSRLGEAASMLVAGDSAALASAMLFRRQQPPLPPPCRGIVQ